MTAPSLPAERRWARLDTWPSAWRSWGPAVAAGLATAAISSRGASVTEKALEVAVAVTFVLAVAARPGASLFGLLVWLPISLVPLGLLYHYVAPAVVVRGLGAIKDATTIGLLLAAAKWRPKRSFDFADWLAAAYLAWATIRLLVPFVVHGLLGAQPFHIRILAWRQDVEYLGVFLGARYAPIHAVWRSRIGGAIMATGVVIAAGGLVETLASSSFNRFMVDVVRVNGYLTNVLGAKIANPSSVLTYENVGGHQVARAGSFLLNSITMPFYLLVPFGLLVALLVRGHRSFLPSLGLLVVGAGILVTITRSAYLGGIVATLGGLYLAIRRRSFGRVPLGVLLVTVILLAVPFGAGTAVAHRLGASIKSADTLAHVHSTTRGLTTALSHPLGNGLGTVAGTGQRFTVAGAVIAENSYLQVADELGIAAMVVFIALLVTVVRRLYRTALTDRSEWFGAGVFCAGLGLAVSGLLLHVWLDYSTALTFWGAAGLALSRAELDASATPGDRRLASRRLPAPR